MQTRGPSLLTLVVPPSYAAMPAERRGLLIDFLSRGTALPVELSFADSYDTLATRLLSGEATAAWAPPFAGARLETAGASIVVRAVRNGQATYRAALVCRADRKLSAEALKGLRAAWVDRESVGGHLLVAAWLREQGLDAERTFSENRFLGSYQAALRAVLTGEADVCSCFCPPASVGDTLGVEDYAPGHGHLLKALAFTGEAPNDGIAVAPLTPPAVREALEQTFLRAHRDPTGQLVLSTLFRAERFEPAPPQGYKHLYQAVRTLR